MIRCSILWLVRRPPPRFPLMSVDDSEYILAHNYVVVYWIVIVITRACARAQTESESRVYHYKYYYPDTQSPGDPG